MTLKQFIILALVGALIGLLASGVEKWWQQDQPAASKTQLERLPEFSLTSVDGSTWHSEQWTHKILVLNFWATWCPPCREEMPIFNKLQEEFAQQDVQFIGIAIDDREAVQEFIDSYAIDFTILMGDTQAVALSERLGNRFSALPFTVVVDKGGKVRLRHAGGVKEEHLRPVLAELSK
jgi:peroxiredoxin